MSYCAQKCSSSSAVCITSTSRNTSRISGFSLEFLPRVLPRTVRLRALTRSFTASAWCFGSLDKMGASSDVGCSRPFIMAKQFMLKFLFDVAKNIHKIVSDSLHKQFNISEVVRDNVDCDSQNYIRTNLLTIRGTNSSNIS